MQFDFDEAIDRSAVPALKTHPRVLGEARRELFAAGVADMDFRVSPYILDALRQRLEHGLFGYEAVPDGLIPAMRNWMLDRHSWEIDEAHILRAPNALNGLSTAACLFSKSGQGVIVQPPAFFDFYDIIRENNRRLVRNPLILNNGRYEMDYKGLEELAAEAQNKILFLCNPHNPVGRVWTRAELEKVADICRRHGVLVVADELHGDITFPGHRYTPFASLEPNHANNCVTVLSPAKTFNIASCCSAFTVIAGEERRAAFQAANSRLSVNKNNAFSNVAMEAAYRHGGPWLDAVLNYLHGNLTLVRDRIGGMSDVALIEPEGTFLLWLDFRPLGLGAEDLTRFLREEAGWAVTRGIAFGEEGNGFARLNIACRREALSSAFDRLAEALGTRNA